VSDKGTRSFALVARYPGSTNPTRRLIGEYGAISLEQARTEARKWHELLHRGVDPGAEREQRKQAETKKRSNTFANVAEDFIAHVHRQGQRRAVETERDIRGIFFPRWANRPITDITRADVIEVMDEMLRRDARHRAQHVYSYASRLFGWALERGVYGLEY